MFQLPGKTPLLQSNFFCLPCFVHWVWLYKRSAICSGTLWRYQCCPCGSIQCRPHCSWFNRFQRSWASRIRLRPFRFDSVAARVSYPRGRPWMVKRFKYAGAWRSSNPITTNWMLSTIRRQVQQCVAHTGVTLQQQLGNLHFFCLFPFLPTV